MSIQRCRLCTDDKMGEDTGVFSTNEGAIFRKSHVTPVHWQDNDSKHNGKMGNERANGKPKG